VYYTAQYDSAILRPDLKKHVVFAQHNLAMDTSFNEFHLIMCRNVMIYFNKALQGRVIDLFRDSLVRQGFLCLGSKETLKGTGREAAFAEFDPVERIYRAVPA
jgi:chemotaxis protein methyltransferase CheR